VNRVSAIVVIGETPREFSETDRPTQADKLAPFFAELELLGSSPLQRTVDRLESVGVERIVVISSGRVRANVNPGTMHLAAEDSDSAWELAAQIARSHSEEGSDLVLIMRLGAYVEFSLDRVIENHRERSKGITRLWDQLGALDIWLIDSERIRRCQHLISARDLLIERASRCVACSYVNRLSSALDLRRLAIDIMLMRCATRPNGTQVKPGVWVEPSAQIDRTVRLVGPSYVGRNTRVRPSVLLTRLSHVESDCDIDSGTVIEDSSILSNTYIGPSLDVTHAIVCGSHITNLKKNVALEVLDPLLISSASSGSGSKPVRHRAMATQWMGRFVQTS